MRFILTIILGYVLGFSSGITYDAEASTSCVSYSEYNSMPRTNKGQIEKHLKQRGVRDDTYDEFAAEFGFDVGNTRKFDYVGCEKGRTYEIYYEFEKGKVRTLVASAY